ncbi:MAG TPA: hypothetical protein VGK67_00875 [Myxococcales bacterium]
MAFQISEAYCRMVRSVVDVNVDVVVVVDVNGDGDGDGDVVGWSALEVG